jgi:hypothetical protein
LVVRLAPRAGFFAADLAAVFAFGFVVFFLVEDLALAAAFVDFAGLFLAVGFFLAIGFFLLVGLFAAPRR